ncbi:uncharacterized protein [Setaria viridis]|uniref:uncharacterized protein isoform X3 n=1 Tax=Setaria viridis TaxID=4556 RepID=UPI0014933CAD|nr:serine/threonine-protein kinase 4 homolog B-like isoform X3 [Setaria viridis]
MERKFTLSNKLCFAEMHGQENENEALERILNDASAEPIMLSYRFLESITENFSRDREIGTGGFGVVYMGIIRNMKVAIKKLSRIDDFSEMQFEDELKCLKRVKHKNIVRLLGYCSETPKEVVKYNGTYVLAEYRIRILCFEYVPNKSLHDYIKDESRERDWVTSYHLIEGVCQGLYYLHNKERINHLDLKPSNILLDADMDPKISDFGLSRRFSGEHSRIITEHIRGTPGYIAPEYLNKGEISFKTDIYSLGIIIMKLLMGRNDDLFDFEGLHKSADKDCPQMKRCIKIAQLCVDPDQQRRPTIDNIIDMLNVKESMKDDARPSLEQPGRMNPGKMHFTSEAVDEKQEEAISGAKQLNQKKNHIEGNMRLANDLKAEEEELYLFTSSLLSMLAEYNVCPPQINASTITTGTKRLYQQLYWKIRSLNIQDSLGDMTPSRNEPSPSYNMDANRNTLRYAQVSSDRHVEQMYHGSHFQQDIVGTPSNYFEENVRNGEARVDGDSQLYRHENQDYPADGDPLPGIEDFQIVGEPRLGSILTACGFPTNGTTLCNFQWVRHLENGTRQSIEDATMYDYVVTADDVGTLLAVDCTPMDVNDRQGNLVTKFANNGNFVTCDPEMQNHIDACILNGKAEFEVFVLHAYSRWELATLVLTRPSYQIKLKHTGEVIIDEKYSSYLQTKLPLGRTTQFVLVNSTGAYLPFKTEGLSDPYNEAYDVRLRDLIVLVMRTFQKKALDAKRKGKAHQATKESM